VVQIVNALNARIWLVLRSVCSFPPRIHLTSFQALKQVKSTLRDRRDRNQKIELSDTDLAEPDTTDLDSPKLPLPSSFEGVAATPFKIRSRKFTPNDEVEAIEGGSMREVILPTGGPSSSPQAKPPSVSSSSDFELSPDTTCEDDSRPLKIQRVEQQTEQREPVYPFFGPRLPPTTKLIALSCLEYLDGPSLYAMSCVNHLWSQAAMDDALWE
jgi:hypothetical protein